MSMSRLSWLLNVLRRLVQLFRGSVRFLQFIFAVLQRQLKRKALFAENDLSPCDSSSKAIRYDFDNAHSGVICASAQPSLGPGGNIPTVSIETFPHSPLHQSSCASRELATPYLEEHDLAHINVPSHPNTPDPPSHVELDISDCPLRESPIEYAFPAREDPYQPTPSTGLLVLEPMLPTVVLDRRYDRNYDIPKTLPQLVVKQGAKEFTLENLPPEWTACTHPEGNLYFRRRHRNMNILTNAYLCHEPTLKSVTAYINKIDNMHQNFEADDLVLELTQDRDEVTCGYYFVYHQSRSLLWFEDFDVSFEFEEIKGATSDAHIKYEIQSQYWRHWETFPSVCNLTDDIIHELRGILLYASADSLTSNNSTAPYSWNDLRSMIDITDRLKVTDGPPSENSYYAKESVNNEACVAGRFLATFVHQKFLHYHGQNGARLCRDQSVHSSQAPERTWLIKLFSPFLFCAPDVHLKALESILVDNMVSHVPWNELIAKLNDDWERYSFFSTVILAANVGFLAIGTFNASSVATVASYLSVITSGGSAMIGLLLFRQNKTKDRSTADAALQYLQTMKHPTCGLESLAIRYSLPYALIMWGTGLFMFAFLCMSVTQSDTAARILVCVILTLVGIILLWSILTAWESEERYWWSSWFTEMRQSCKAAVDNCTKHLPPFSRRRSWGSEKTAVEA